MKNIFKGFKEKFISKFGNTMKTKKEEKNNLGYIYDMGLTKVISTNSNFKDILDIAIVNKKHCNSFYLQNAFDFFKEKGIAYICVETEPIFDSVTKKEVKPAEKYIINSTSMSNSVQILEAILKNFEENLYTHNYFNINYNDNFQPKLSAKREIPTFKLTYYFYSNIAKEVTSYKGVKVNIFDEEETFEAKSSQDFDLIHRFIGEIKKSSENFLKKEDLSLFDKILEK